MLLETTTKRIVRKYNEYLVKHNMIPLEFFKNVLQLKTKIVTLIYGVYSVDITYKTIIA